MVSHPVYFDAVLHAVTEDRLVLDYFGRKLELSTFLPISDWMKSKVGKVGVVQFEPNGECWRFSDYLDQSMRRAFELDGTDRIGWINDANPAGWTAPRCVIPGENGQFVEDETSPVTIDVPLEFYDLCNRHEVTPETVLRGFVADVCDLVSYVRAPRADGYSSNGSDERSMAADYFDRAHSWRAKGD